MTFEVLSSETVYDGVLSTVRVDTLRTPAGETVEREVVRHLDAVGIVAVTDDREVVLVRQYRHPVGTYLLEVPAGMLDIDEESPAEAAHRELAEEVGLAAQDLVELVTFHNSAGWNDERTTVYLATGLRRVAAPEGFTAEAEEADMTLVRMPLDEALERGHRGEITDAKTLIGLLLTHARLAGA